jgi:hypothetical protein
MSEAFGWSVYLAIAGGGCLLIMYWTVRLAQFTDAQWPGHSTRNVLVTFLGFFPIFIGGWLILTLLWPLVWFGNRRNRSTAARSN